ncbi:hypothetical protein B0H34DRAFT_799931 [Crassisporium funariophilum]|nr:hypothetical protein B0H34DRAFT_799931 [Crassisporium funariophilum]
MLSHDRRQFWKRTLSLTKVKILYTRITLTRFTTLYFFSALVACITLSSLQAVTFVDNSNAVTALSSVIAESQFSDGLAVIRNGWIQVCDSIPDQPGTNCTAKISLKGQDITIIGATLVPATRVYSMGIVGDLGPVKRDVFNKQSLWNRDDDEDDDDDDEDDYDDALSSLNLEVNCVGALKWLDDVLHDAQREDIVTCLFQFWLFTLALVTLLNESIPHLGAALLGHILGAAWAAYRVESTYRMMKTYRNDIVPGLCNDVDLLGNWWEVRIHHAIPIVVVNVIALVASCYFSSRLFKVYSNQSFSRVGALPAIHRMYKASFFSLASTGMWIDKVCHATMMDLAKHSKLYLAAFIVTMVLLMPWLFFGWMCVRRECKISFLIVCAISTFLLTISTVLFHSPLYRYIFITWPFFATVTVTSYVLIIVTTVFGVLCRLNFGKGLAHYLQVTDALEGVDFTPVYFPKGQERDTEKAALELDFKDSGKAPQLPALAYQNKKTRGDSVYSQISGGPPIMLSSSPPLASELGPVPKMSRWSRFSSRQSASGLSTTTRGVRFIERDSIYTHPRPVPRIQPSSGRTLEKSFYSPNISSPTPSSPSSSPTSPTPTYTSSHTVNPFSVAVPVLGLPANPRPKPSV